MSVPLFDISKKRNKIIWDNGSVITKKLMLIYPTESEEREQYSHIDRFG